MKEHDTTVFFLWCVHVAESKHVCYQEQRCPRLSFAACLCGWKCIDTANIVT